MVRILSGIETEYGLWVEGRTAEDQLEDAAAFVRAYQGRHFSGWDYRYESPRTDLRGFAVSRLAVDPVDARFDAKRHSGDDCDLRSDRILPNGARFYNDHGHPEYSTPECWSSREVALQDAAGELALLRTAKYVESETGREVRCYKNNTDFHGATYGTHESYLVPRDLGFERLYLAVVPMLIARQVLCGAGKVGSESGRACEFQLSQRADFFVEPFSTDTLYRRPVFNTRDEPHADRSRWIRLHVICGDANRILSATARKVGLVKLALALEMQDCAPVWRLRDPVRAFQSVSRDSSGEFAIELEGGVRTTAREVIESYLSAAERAFGLRPGCEVNSWEGEAFDLITECRTLLEDFSECPDRFAHQVDWAAKKRMIEQFMETQDLAWSDASLRSFDLEYHNIDPEVGLFRALQDIGLAEGPPDHTELESRLEANREGTRALARGLAVSKFSEHLTTASWRSLVFNFGDSEQEIMLDPERRYPAQLQEAEDVGTFISCLTDSNLSEAKTDSQSR